MGGDDFSAFLWQAVLERLSKSGELLFNICLIIKLIFSRTSLLITFHYFLNKAFSLIILVKYNLEMFYMIFIFKIIHRKLHQVWCSVVEYYF